MNREDIVLLALMGLGLVVVNLHWWIEFMPLVWLGVAISFVGPSVLIFKPELLDRLAEKIANT